MGRPTRNYQRNTVGELARDWRFGGGQHSRANKHIVRGVVEYNRDPDHRGRVMVRTIEDGPEMKIHPDKKKEPRVATFTLGWCSPLFGMGAGAGFGSFIVPPVGARVYVLYERGDLENGVYFGGWFANSDRQRKYGATDTTLTPPKKQFDEDDGFDEDGKSGGDFLYPPKPPPYHGQWTVEQGPEIPLELVEMIDHTPDNQLLFKTLKGASLLVKERDEAEELVLTDRLGAELRFESNTELLEEGVLRRGRVSAMQHEPISLDNLAFSRHTMSLLTAPRTGLEVANTSDNGDDSLRLQIHPEHPYIKNPELMDTRVAVELDEGEQRVRIIYLEGGTAVGQLEFDAISKTLNINGLESTRITADTDIELTAPKVRIIGNLDVEGEIRHLGGEKFTFLDNENDPYGAPTRNYWTHNEPTIPWPQHDPVAETQLNERRWW